MLSCCSLTRYALTSKKQLTLILDSFLQVGNRMCSCHAKIMKRFPPWPPQFAQHRNHVENLHETHVRQIIGGAMMDCALSDMVELSEFGVYPIGGGAPAYQIYADVESYKVRLGLRRGPLYGFTLMLMPSHRRRYMNRCDCEVGLQNKMCKHVKQCERKSWGV